MDLNQINKMNVYLIAELGKGYYIYGFEIFTIDKIDPEEKWYIGKREEGDTITFKEYKI